MAQDEFTIFLVIGLVIIAILIAAFNITPEPGQGERNLSFAPVTIFNDSTLMNVGPQQFSVVRRFAFSFDTSNVRETQTVDVGSAVIQSGALFNEEDFDYRITVMDPSRLDISFTVTKSNELEPLIVQVNGRTVASEIYEPGEYRIRVSNEFLSDDMVVSFIAASSGWQIWAPNLYELEDIKIQGEGYVNQADNLIFDIDEEFDTFSFGKIDVSLSENVGRLTTRLNLATIYSATSQNAFAIPIHKRDLRKGQNIINMIAESDSRFSGTAVVTIFYFRERDFEVRTPLRLNRFEFIDTAEVVVDFKIVNVARPGGLALRLENNNGIAYRDFAAVNGAAQHRFVIGREVVDDGLNFIVFSSLDGAIFDIADLEMELR